MSSSLYRQYVQTGHVAAALVGLLVFAYAFVVQLEAFTGIFAGATAALGVLLLSDLAERGYPPVLGLRGTYALVVGVVAFLVVWFVTQRPLSGLGIAPLLAVSVWALAWLWRNGYPESLGRRRSLVTGFVGTGLVAYGSLYGVTSFLAGVCAALLVGLGSWLTSPRGPVLD
ncbi:hypothetical protein ACFQJC_08930 [Haloferax namakaokahaiae]|uniref:Acid-resistance membrane protein n=1 Tax=Haloferax namakaokahaiae TaxID=1748331 RepID=A0ABD5ZF42_9EURY